METHFNIGGGHMPGRGELPLKANPLAVAARALAETIQTKRKMTALGTPIPSHLHDLENVRKEIVAIHEARERGNLTPRCRGYRSDDLNRLMTRQMVLEKELDMLAPDHPMERPKQ